MTRANVIAPGGLFARLPLRQPAEYLFERLEVGRVDRDASRRLRDQAKGGVSVLDGPDACRACSSTITTSSTVALVAVLTCRLYMPRGRCIEMAFKNARLGRWPQANDVLVAVRGDQSRANGWDPNPARGLIEIGSSDVRTNRHVLAWTEARQD